ncbi:MAG: PaeR7I family type II restriction endonuclease [Methanomassiliicoccaceae archaeon]|nr:PaeR7I family type II restriction endonuclease [Methanomassiliicoccaceae archaeon]
MRKELEEAILHSFLVREKAAEVQIERGVVDTGMRSQVTSGKHLDRLIDVMTHDMEGCGAPVSGIFSKNSGTELPGWFRATKKWDILLFIRENLAAAVELKTIYGSYGNNLNNRAEEAVGVAVDAKMAIEKELMNRAIPPLLGYVLIVKKEEGSVARCMDPREPHFKTDAVFHGTSYIGRLMAMCQRLSREGLYGAVWFVVADPLSGSVEEPDPQLSYDRFIAEIIGKIGAFNAGSGKGA